MSKKRISKKRQLQEAISEAEAAYSILTDEERGQLEEQVNEIIGDLSYYLNDALNECAWNALESLNALAQKYGRGIVRLALANCDSVDLDHDVPYFGNDLIEYDWTDELADYQDVPGKVGEIVAMQIDAAIATPEAEEEPKGTEVMMVSPDGTETGLGLYVRD